MKASTLVWVAVFVSVAALVWLFSNIQLSCSDLEHMNLDSMDSATKTFYFQNCK